MLSRKLTKTLAKLATVAAIGGLLAKPAVAQQALVSAQQSSRQVETPPNELSFNIRPLALSTQADARSSLSVTPISVPTARMLPSVPQIDLPVGALADDALRLEQLQGIATASHPDVLRMQSLVSAARSAAFQSGRQANPSVGIDFQQLFSNGQAEQYGLTLDQRVIRKDKRRLDRAVASHEVHNQQQSLEATRLRISTNVRLAFIGVLSAQRQIDVARQLLGFNRDALELTKRLLAADEVPKTDVLGAELELRTATLELKSAENRHIFAWKQLEEAVSQPLPSAPLAGDLTAGTPKGSYEELLAQLRRESPEVALAISEIEQAKCFLARQRVEPLPDVSARGLLNWRDNGIGGGMDAGVAVSVPFPVWDKNEGAISQAFHQLQAASRRLEQVELVLAARLTPVYEKYLDAGSRVATYRDDILPIARQSLDLTRQTYEQGEASFQSLLLAGRTHAENQIRYLDALESLRKSEARLDGLVLGVN